ncbi:MAG: RecQ family zinc-binding domain-containing protein, partial [Duganella sp.]
GKLLKRNRKLDYAVVKPRGAAPDHAPKAAQFADMAKVYADKHERDREGLEQMVGYAQSGYCRWKLLLDYFSDASPGFEKCCKCDNCLSPPSIQDVPAQAAEPLATLAVGATLGDVLADAVPGAAAGALADALPDALTQPSADGLPAPLSGAAAPVVAAQASALGAMASLRTAGTA